MPHTVSYNDPKNGAKLKTGGGIKFFPTVAAFSFNPMCVIAKPFQHFL
jgi:hypothetical protein